MVKGATGLNNYLQFIQGYLAAPIFVEFFFGVYWKRLNAQGCLWAMVIGFVVGLFRILVDTPVTLGLAVHAPRTTFAFCFCRSVSFHCVGSYADTPGAVQLREFSRRTGRFAVEPKQLDVSSYWPAVRQTELRTR